eukprot:scaffold1387_cov260-Pinguiococcus_pyrenoidosus.AAC.19
MEQVKQDTQEHLLNAQKIAESNAASAEAARLSAPVMVAPETNSAAPAIQASGQSAMGSAGGILTAPVTDTQDGSGDIIDVRATGLRRSIAQQAHDSFASRIVLLSAGGAGGVEFAATASSTGGNESVPDGVCGRREASPSKNEVSEWLPLRRVGQEHPHCVDDLAAGGGNKRSVVCVDLGRASATRI